ncbi:MAG: hypothetical protein WA902_09790, partial [Thermosynechococcaceae cyanobacterium]
MFFVLNSIPPTYLTDSSPFFAEVDIQKRRNWQISLEDIYDRKIKFHVKWVTIGSRTYFKQGASIDGPPPIPTLAPPGIVLTEEEDTFFDFDYDLRIFILDSPKIYWLSNTSDPKVLDALVQLLDVPDRAWAANVILAKMLGKANLGDFKIREDKAEQWWEIEGKTGKAKQEWAAYLEKVKPTMKWSVLGGYYKHITPSGET